MPTVWQAYRIAADVWARLCEPSQSLRTFFGIDQDTEGKDTLLCALELSLLRPISCAKKAL